MKIFAGVAETPGHGILRSAKSASTVLMSSLAFSRGRRSAFWTDWGAKTTYFFSLPLATSKEKGPTYEQSGLHRMQYASSMAAMQIVQTRASGVLQRNAASRRFEHKTL